tara:strand:- start:417 stop:842 length:426 start_codon:yes stop_codon:yes gene_type:complete
MNSKNFDFNTILNHLKILAINPFFSIPLFGIILVNIWNIDIEGIDFPLNEVTEGFMIEFSFKISLVLTIILYLVSIIFKKIYNGLNLWGPIIPAGLILFGLLENTYVFGFIFVFILCSVGIFYGSRYLGNKFENYFIDPSF